MDPQRNQPAVPVVWILWGAFTWAAFIYGGVGFYLRSTGGTAVDADSAASLLQVVALVSGLVSSMVITIGAPYAAKLLGNHQAWLIVRCAFAELPALMGFTAFYMGGTSVAFVAMLAWAVGLMLLSMPTSRDREGWDEHKKQLERQRGRGR